MSDIAGLVRTGRFAEAERALKYNSGGAFEVLLVAAHEDSSTLFYAFLAYLIARDETAERHYMACRLMSTALCCLPDVYATALYHSRRALALDPDNVDVKKDMLLFYDVPERLLSREEAGRISQEVQVSDPVPTVAQAIQAGVNPELLVRLRE